MKIEITVSIPFFTGRVGSQVRREIEIEDWEHLSAAERDEAAYEALLDEQMFDWSYKELSEGDTRQ